MFMSLPDECQTQKHSACLKPEQYCLYSGQTVIMHNNFTSLVTLKDLRGEWKKIYTFYIVTLVKHFSLHSVLSHDSSFHMQIIISYENDFCESV